MTLSPIVIACSFELGSDGSTNGRIQLFPFGRFFPADKREGSEGGWYVDDSNGAMLADQINLLAIDLMIDYEHQTLYIEQNGQPNPAAGWIKRAEYISGEGLFADVEWTAKASQQIKAKEYRYISPLFIPEQDGKVTKVLNAALTNRPALHNLAEAFALSSQFNQKDIVMLKLLQQLFGADNATEDEIKQKLTALCETKGTSQVALSEVYIELHKQSAEVVALNEQVKKGVDPTQYVALAEMKAVQDELTSLKTQMTANKVDALVSQALSEGRLLPAQKEWATHLGKTNLQALSDYLETTVPNPALVANQAKEKPVERNVVALSDAEKATAKMLGMSEAEFIKEHKEQA